MVIETETFNIKPKHNPDKNNLKSLLKPEKSCKDNEKKNKKRRVVFNENKNEFFDADYIILIREECDFDEDDEDSVCTCNQHEMVRLECCDPDCACLYEEYDQGAGVPQSPKFAPPIEFVDALTLSPPEGYKDMELAEQQLLALQQLARRGEKLTLPAATVCRECMEYPDDPRDANEQNNYNEEEESQSDEELRQRWTDNAYSSEDEKQKTDQSQQTTPTTPPSDEPTDGSETRFILETITTATTTEQSFLRPEKISKSINENQNKSKKVISDDNRKSEKENFPRRFSVGTSSSPINGILKGGRLWKQQSLDQNSPTCLTRSTEVQEISESDDEATSKRAVRFFENQPENRDSCDGASDTPHDAEDERTEIKRSENARSHEALYKSKMERAVNEATEMTLTFKLGNHVLISNNSLKPNSAVRQLFPCTKPPGSKERPEGESNQQYLVTAESLRAFEEAKRAKIPQLIQSGETDESIKRAIEKNTLRKSLIRYEPKIRKHLQKPDNSLMERIKQLTCNVDEEYSQQDSNMTSRQSPTGEESVPSDLKQAYDSKNLDNRNSLQSYSNYATILPSSSTSTSSSNSNLSAMSSTYKKLTDLFGKKEKEKMFSSDLQGKTEQYYYQMCQQNQQIQNALSSVGTECSQEDINEALKNNCEEKRFEKNIAPDVLAGTPSAVENGDELAMFVQQDAGRMERIKKKYQPNEEKEKKVPVSNNSDDDEHDDYGFNRRPSVRSIKPQSITPNHIEADMQNEIEQATLTDANLGKLNNNIAYAYNNDSSKQLRRVAGNPAYYPYYPECVEGNKPTDQNLYQNIGGMQWNDVGRAYSDYCYGCNEDVPRRRSGSCGSTGSGGRACSPPPMEIRKYKQTMVYVPYNNIEGYQQLYHNVSNQNHINKCYTEPIYQQRIQVYEGEENNPNISTNTKYFNYVNGQQQPQPIMSRSESPMSVQYCTARSTQTPVKNSCGYYQGNPRYRAVFSQTYQTQENIYVSASMNNQGFLDPASLQQKQQMRYQLPVSTADLQKVRLKSIAQDDSSLTDMSDTESLYSCHTYNTFQQTVTAFNKGSNDYKNRVLINPNSRQTDINFPASNSCQNENKSQIDLTKNSNISPVKGRYDDIQLQRGVPEGAASVSPTPAQDATIVSQNIKNSMPLSDDKTTPKSTFYSMNV